MEWGDGHTIDGRPQKHWYEVSDQDIFAFAGVWKDSEIPSFAILSCPANAELQGIGRGRMPVVLPAFGDAQNTWLFGDWKRASALLQPYSSSLLREVQEPALKKQDGPQKELE
jgi:putative SOS response-associated peptidase YedK